MNVKCSAAKMSYINAVHVPSMYKDPNSAAVDNEILFIRLMFDKKGLHFDSLSHQDSCLPLLGF